MADGSELVFNGHDFVGEFFVEDEEFRSAPVDCLGQFVSVHVPVQEGHGTTDKTAGEEGFEKLAAVVEELGKLVLRFQSQTLEAVGQAEDSVLKQAEGDSLFPGNDGFAVSQDLPLGDQKVGHDFIQAEVEHPLEGCAQSHPTGSARDDLHRVFRPPLGDDTFQKPPCLLHGGNLGKRLHQIYKTFVLVCHVSFPLLLLTNVKAIFITRSYLFQRCPYFSFTWARITFPTGLKGNSLTKTTVLGLLKPVILSRHHSMISSCVNSSPS